MFQEIGASSFTTKNFGDMRKDFFLINLFYDDLFFDKLPRRWSMTFTRMHSFAGICLSFSLS